MGSTELNKIFYYVLVSSVVYLFCSSRIFFPPLVYTCCFSSRLLAVSHLVCLLILLSPTCCFSSRLLVVSPLVCLLFIVSSTCCFSFRILAVPLLSTWFSSCLIAFLLVFLFLTWLVYCYDNNHFVWVNIFLATSIFKFKVLLISKDRHYAIQVILSKNR